MSMTATVDPAETITAAVRELYEQLREIVDRGPTDDPGLLDELGKLTGRIRSRITRAKKRAAATAEPKPAATAPSPRPVTPLPAQPATAPATTVPAPVPASAVPAPKATPGERVTVRLPEPAKPNPSPTESTQNPAAQARTLRTRPQILVVALILLVAVLIAATDNPTVGFIAAVAVIAHAGWRFACRILSGSPR